MRNILIPVLAVLIAMPLYATDSGILEDFVQEPKQRGYGIKNIINGNSIKYYADWGSFAPQEDVLENAFREWVFGTKRIIEEQNRADEFKDLYPIFEIWAQKPILKKTTKALADIRFYPREATPGSDGISIAPAGGFWHYYKKIVYNYGENKALMHEIGHFLGVGEGYLEQKHHNSKIHSSSYFYEDGIMGNKNENTLLSCDDADSFITSVDFVLEQSGKISERVEKGWRSLCKDNPAIFKRVKEMNREPDIYSGMCW